MKHLWNLTALAACSALTLGLTACGGDDGDSGPETVDDPATTMSAVSSANDAKAIKDTTGDEADLKAKVTTVANSIQAIRSNYIIAQGKEAGAGAAAGVQTAMGAQAAPASMAPAVSSMVTFMNNHLDASFTVEGNYAGQMVVYNYIAKMDIVPAGESATIDGTFDISYESTINTAIFAAAAAAQGAPAGSIPDTIQVDYEFHATYNAVVVGACPESGSLTLVYKANIAVEGGSSAITDALADNPEYGEGTMTVTYSKDEAGACAATVEVE